jgi:enoyl-[acyl-carrier protein] reductase III
LRKLGPVLQSSPLPAEHHAGLTGIIVLRRADLSTKPLGGKVAVITGGGRGIGRAITLELAEMGADVCVNYLRKRSTAEATTAEAQAKGVRAVAIKANVGDEEQVRKLVLEARETLGSVDILVANAASGVLKPVIQQDTKSWDWTMNINARSILFAAKAAAPLMIERGWGRIVTLTSIGSVRVLPEYSIVGISKAAIEAITRYLAVELAPHGIRVNAVSPGVVDTGALKFFPSRDRLLSEAERRTPVGRLVEPEDVAKIVGFLCSEDADMICGQTVFVDGGYSILA